jgi:hypothetical protein
MRKKRIFISCGQRTSQEKIFGKEVQTLINQHMDGFFAEEAHDAADLNTSLFRAAKLRRVCCGDAEARKR